MTPAERAYHDSKADSVEAAAWAFFACAILLALASISYVCGGLS